MFDKIKDFLFATIDSGEFVVADFLAVLKDVLAAIFGFIKEEEEIA